MVKMINLMLYAILKIKHGVNYQEVKKKSNEGDFFFSFSFFVWGRGSTLSVRMKQSRKAKKVGCV